MRAACIILVVVSMLIIQATTVDSQTGSSLQESGPKSNKLVSDETYKRVLDIVFPRNEPAGDYYLVLRFRPSFHPTSQVVIKRGLDKVEVIEYTSLSGNIYMKLNEFMSHGGKEDAVEMAKLIKVRRRSLQVPNAQVKQWHTSFLESLGESLKTFRKRSEQFDKAGTVDVVLDGTFYDMWYSQDISDMSFSFYDEEVSDRQPNGVLKAVRWMNFVRQEVEKLK
jgi:hypothetical protein